MSLRMTGVGWGMLPDLQCHPDTITSKHNSLNIHTHSKLGRYKLVFDSSYSLHFQKFFYIDKEGFLS